MLTVPTRIATTRHSLLDHIYIHGNWSKEINLAGVAAVIQIDISDHLPIAAQFHTKTKKKNLIDHLSEKYRTRMLKKCVRFCSKT